MTERDHQGEIRDQDNFISTEEWDNELDPLDLDLVDEPDHYYDEYYEDLDFNERENLEDHGYRPELDYSDL